MIYGSTRLWAGALLWLLPRHRVGSRLRLPMLGGHHPVLVLFPEAQPRHGVEGFAERARLWPALFVLYKMYSKAAIGTLIIWFGVWCVGYRKIGLAVTLCLLVVGVNALHSDHDLQQTEQLFQRRDFPGGERRR